VVIFRRLCASISFAQSNNPAANRLGELRTLRARIINHSRPSSRRFYSPDNEISNWREYVGGWVGPECQENGSSQTLSTFVAEPAINFHGSIVMQYSPDKSLAVIASVLTALVIVGCNTNGRQSETGNSTSDGQAERPPVNREPTGVVSPVVDNRIPDASAAESSAPGEKASEARSSNQVATDNFTFTPQSLTVPVGTNVTWINRDDVPHTVVDTEKRFRSTALDTDDSFSFTFTAPGEYPYYCGIHPHMTGTIVVK
jgi:plastocyanin